MLVRKRFMLMRKQATNKLQFHTHSRALDPLQPGDSVVLEQISLGQKVWTRAQITQRLDEKSYIAQPEKGSLVRQNRVDLKKIPLFA